VADSGRAPVAAWRRTDETSGLAVARVERTADGWLAHGQEVLVPPGRPVGCSFAVELDTDWYPLHLIATSIDEAAQRALELRRDKTDAWWRDGERAPELDGCRDVDVAATPLTNTFPVNRLGRLEVGRSWTGPVAWIDVPTLQVHRVTQTYTRMPDPDDALAVAAWQYQDEMYGPFLITVDRHGLVVDYEGFAIRIRNTSAR
jgi:hypothetical protein